MDSKPECKLIGEDGNIFNLLGKARNTLRRNKMNDKAEEFSKKIFDCGSYEEALNLISEYVTII